MLDTEVDREELFKVSCAPDGCAAFSCSASKQRGSRGSCEESLRFLLPLWHQQIKTDADNIEGLAKASPVDPAALARAQLALQLTTWAASSTTEADIRYRLYGGDTSVNEANDRYAAAEGRRAVDAAQRALRSTAHAPPALRAAVKKLSAACR